MLVVIERLQNYGQVIVNGNHVRVAIPSINRHDRMHVLQNIHRDFQDFCAALLTDRPDYSSIGYVKIQNLKICVKSQRQQKQLSPGVPNEQFLVQKINKYLLQHAAINLIFLSETIAVRYIDVTECIATENRKLRTGRNKADMIIKTATSQHAVSIKQSDAERWESADTARGKQARAKLDDALHAGKTQLLPALTETAYPIYRNGNREQPVMRIEPEIYWRMSTDEQLQTMFGDDIDHTGAIVVNTFNNNDFDYDAPNKNLKINCSKIHTRSMEIGSDDAAYWMLRNDITRNCLPLGIAGLRIESVRSSRIKYGIEVD